MRLLLKSTYRLVTSQLEMMTSLSVYLKYPRLCVCGYITHLVQSAVKGESTCLARATCEAFLGRVRPFCKHLWGWEQGAKPPRTLAECTGVIKHMLNLIFKMLHCLNSVIGVEHSQMYAGFRSTKKISHSLQQTTKTLFVLLEITAGYHRSGNP